MLMTTGRQPGFRWRSLWEILPVFLLGIGLAQAEPLPWLPRQIESRVQPEQADAQAKTADAARVARRKNEAPEPKRLAIEPLGEAQSGAQPAARKPGTPHPVAKGREVEALRTTDRMADHLAWQVTGAGGRIAALSLAAKDAHAVRLGLRIHRLPEAAILRFYAPQEEEAFSVSGHEVNAAIKRNTDTGDDSEFAHTYWSPTISGEEAVFEIELPRGVPTSTVQISLPRISHFFEPPLGEQGGNLAKIGESGSCQVDASCYSEWAITAGNATARMTYTKADGGSYLCSGTLLNDNTASGTPYFLSANHCISKQAEASTLQTHWFYRSSACNSGTLDSGKVTLSGGATLLYASAVTDTSFMRLNGTPPAGTIFAGWLTTQPDIHVAAVGLHHPRGDLQKISLGATDGFQDCQAIPDSDSFSCTGGTAATAGFINVAYTSGTTEGGSSGSGVFVLNNGNRYLVGQLYGGNASCGNPDGSHIYGRFDVAYGAALHQWLNAGTTAMLTVSKAGSGSGTVTSSPAGIDCGNTCSAAFARNASVTLTASPSAGVGFGGWSGDCGGTQVTCTLALTAARNVTATFTAPTISFAAALDNASYAWTAGGDKPFYTQSTVAYAGGSAAQSGAIGNSQRSSLSASVTGPGKLSFYWKVSSEYNYDFLTVYVDGVAKSSWSGTGDWTRQEVDIPSGSHAVKWEYAKDGSVASGQDAGWVDKVSFTAAPADSQSPSVPTGLSATAVSTARIDLAWNAATDNVGVTTYRIYRVPSLIATLGTITRYSDTGVAAGTTYSYRVVACDAAGNCSSQSPAVSATTPSTSSSNNLVTNPTFESGSAGWSESWVGGIIDTWQSCTPSGSRCAFLGGYDLADDSLHQDIAIPAIVQQATLEFRYRILTEETTTTSIYDTFSVSLRNPATGTTLASLANFSNLNPTSGWVQSSAYDLSAYRGQTVRLYFKGTTDASLTSSFYVDDVSLNVTNAPGTTGSSTAHAYNIPAPENADKAFIRFYNTSDSAGSVAVTLYDQSGAVLGTANRTLISSLTAKGVQVVTAADIAAAVGVASWSGRAWMAASANFSGLEVMNLIRSSAEGTLLNMSCVDTQYAFYLPSAGGSENAYLRIYNTSASAGAVRGTLYNESGAVIGNANATLAASLAAKAVKVMNAADLAAAVGDNWTGKAWLAITGAPSGLKIMNTLRDTTTDTLANVSCVDTDGGTTGYAYNIPYSDSSARASLRIYNTGATTLRLTGTLRNENGQTLGTAGVSLGSIAPKAVKTLTIADLIALTGAGWWSGRAWLEAHATDSGMRLLGFTQQSMLMDMSCVTDDIVFNIPDASNSQDQPMIRLYNTSDAAGTVYSALYDMSGRVLGAGNTALGVLPAKSVKVFSAGSLATTLGAGSWSARAWMRLSADFGGLKALNILQNRVNGNTANMSCAVN